MAIPKKKEEEEEDKRSVAYGIPLQH